MEDEIVVIGQLRDPNEDYIAVFDGHSGRDSSEFAANNLYKVKFWRENNF
jgi:serine/threonine protein phosphatase PrpC